MDSVGEDCWSHAGRQVISETVGVGGKSPEGRELSRWPSSTARSLRDKSTASSTCTCRFTNFWRENAPLDRAEYETMEVMEYRGSTGGRSS